MQIKCYGNRVRTVMDADVFAAFRAEDKYVIGVLPDGVELMLLDGVTLKAIELAVPTLMRVSRATLVAREHVTGLIGAGHHRNVLTVVGEYRLARRQRAEPFAIASQENAQAKRRQRCPARTHAPAHSVYGCH